MYFASAKVTTIQGVQALYSALYQTISINGSSTLIAIPTVS
jgi:hypothetical protein